MADARVKNRAKELSQRGGDDVIVTLSTGIRVKLNAVSASLIEDVKTAIPYPDVPVVWIEAKDREEENPSDPKYIEGCKRTERERISAMLDATIMFGVELVDGMPDDDKWMKKLRMLERRKILDLSGFDLNDDFDCEFLYKRYVAVAGADYDLIAPLQSVSPQEVAKARGMFLGDEARLPDRGIRSEGLDSDGNRDEPGDDGMGGVSRGES